jgi:site-specific DNA recombinase
MTTLAERPLSTANGHRPIMTGNAAIYIRVSKERQKDGPSLEVQLEACRRYCEANGLDVIAEFKDIHSGLDANRSQYQQALKLARNKGFNKLVVFRYDRSGRDDAEYFGMLKDFNKLCINLASASGESDDPLYQKFAGVLAWNESRTLSIRVTGSKMKRFERGNWSGKAVFGYSVEMHSEGGSYLVPKAGEAELVTELFTRYATGNYSLNDLRRFLRDVGVLKSRAAILYALRNRTYLGEVPHGKRVTSQFHESPEKITWVKGKHKALVDPETFDRVQTKLSEHKSRQRGGIVPKYLFSGLVYCGNCGRKYTGRSGTNGRSERRWNRYDCSRGNSVGDCESHSVYESRIKDVVIPPIKSLLSKLKEEDIRAAVRAELVRQQEDTKAADRVTKMGAAETLERLEARLSSLEDAYLDGDIVKDRYRARRDELTSQINELQAQLAAKPRLVLPDLEQFFALADALEGDPPDDQEWREIIEGLVDRVVIEGSGDGRKSPPTIKVIWKPEFAPLLETVNQS